jgi:CheY-like chemotaxis protein
MLTTVDIPAHEVSTPLRSYSILLAEDDLLTANAICHFLEEFNINVTHARDGEEALRLYALRPYDLVISDFEMPKKNGLEMLEQIKTVLPSQKIIFLTAYSQQEILFHALDKGVAGYYLKPIDLKRLMNEILNILHIQTEGVISRAHYPLKIKTGTVKLQHAAIEFTGCPGNIRLIDLIVSKLPDPNHERIIISLRFDEKFAVHKDSLQLISNLVDDLVALLHIEPCDIDLGGEYFRKLTLNRNNTRGRLLQCRMIAPK